MAGLHAGLVLAARVVDFWVHPPLWLGAMVLLKVALIRLEARKLVSAMVDAIGGLLVPAL